MRIHFIFMVFLNMIVFMEGYIYKYILEGYFKGGMSRLTHAPQVRI